VRPENPEIVTPRHPEGKWNYPQASPDQICARFRLSRPTPRVFSLGLQPRSLCNDCWGSAPTRWWVARNGVHI